MPDRPKIKTVTELRAYLTKNVPRRVTPTPMFFPEAQANTEHYNTANLATRAAANTFNTTTDVDLAARQSVVLKNNLHKRVQAGKYK